MKYQLPAKPTQYETTIKRSRFIAYLSRASSRAEAEQFINELRKQHPQSNHVCWAYIAGPPNTTIMSMSDDGEPSGTAGRPMLNVLKHSGLGEIAAAVVRYFGGTKLGTGGLQRAYSEAVSEALNILATAEKIKQQAFIIQLPFALESSIRSVLQRYNAIIDDYQYEETITLSCHAAEECYADLAKDIRNRSSGNARIKKLS